MARAKTHPLPETPSTPPDHPPPDPAISAPVASVAAAPDAAPVVYCHQCKHWDRRWPRANMAPCMLSARFLPQPAVTTDLTTCASGEMRA